MGSVFCASVGLKRGMLKKGRQNRNERIEGENEMIVRVLSRGKGIDLLKHMSEVGDVKLVTCHDSMMHNFPILLVQKTAQREGIQGNEG